MFCSTMYYKKGSDQMSFSIRLNDEEKRLAESYAALHAISVGEAFKRALFERIEDEFDVACAEDAYDEYEEQGKKSRPVEELWKEQEL